MGSGDLLIFDRKGLFCSLLYLFPFFCFAFLVSCFAVKDMIVIDIYQILFQCWG